MLCNSGWTLLQFVLRIKKCYEDWANEIFNLVETPHIINDRGWNKEEDGFMVLLDLPHCIFVESESRGSNTSWRKLMHLLLQIQTKYLLKSILIKYVSNG